jgi:hypothetical protein
MAEIIIEKPTMQKVIYTLEKPSEELAFGTIFCLFVLMHMLCVKGMYSIRRNGQDGYIG